MTRKRSSACPMDAILRLLMGPWTTYIIWILSTQGPLRFGALKRAVPGISTRVLTERLRMLERAGVVWREQSQTIPPAVTYGLTERGREPETGAGRPRVCSTPRTWPPNKGRAVESGSAPVSGSRQTAVPPRLACRGGRSGRTGERGAKRPSPTAPHEMVAVELGGELEERRRQHHRRRVREVRSVSVPLCIMTAPGTGCVRRARSEVDVLEEAGVLLDVAEAELGLPSHEPRH